MENALPWLVAYGGVLWRVAIPVFAIAGVIAARVAPRLGARWRAIRARRPGGRAIAVASDLREGQAIVTGTIEARAPLAPDAEVIAGDGAVAVSILRRGRAGDTLAASLRAEDMAIRVGDAIVDIEGEIAIISGSREALPSRFSLASPALHATVSDVDPAVAAELAVADPEILVCALSGGDRVICRGHLRRDRRPEEATDYRNAAARWVLAPAPGGDRARVELVALSGPVLRGEAGRPPPLLRGAIVGLAAFVFVFVVGGVIAIALADRGVPRALEIAAATPLSRAEAIDRLARARAAAPPHHDPAIVREIAALGQIGADCAHVVPALIEHGQVPRTWKFECSRPDALVAQAEAWFEHGDMEVASQLFGRARRRSPETREILAHLLAGRLDVAADTARAAARLTDGRARRSLGCLADWMDLKRADAPTASQHIEAEAYKPATGDGCDLLFADLLLDCKVRIGFFRGKPVADEQLIPGTRPIHALLSDECEMTLEPSATWQRPVSPGWLLYGSDERKLLEILPSMFLAPGLARNSLPRGAFAPQQIAEAAFAASAIGDNERALGWLGPGPSATEVPPAGGVDPGVRGVIELRSRGGHRAAPFVGQPGAPWLTDRLDDWLKNGGGDGEALAHLLDLDPLEADYVYLLGERATQNKAELERWIAWGPRRIHAKSWAGVVAEIENRRLFAKAIDDDADANELFTQLARHRALLLRRDLAVPVAVLEALAITWSPRPEGSSL